MNYNLNRIIGTGYVDRGFNAFKFRAVQMTTNYIKDLIMKRCTIRLTFENMAVIYRLMDILRKYDKHIDKHVQNGYDRKALWVYDGTFPLVINENLLCIVSASYSPVKNSTLKLYLIGPDADAFHQYLNFKLQESSNKDMINYSVAAKSDANGNQNSPAAFWTCMASKIRPRSFDTLYFDNNIEEKIKNHLQTWLDNYEIYKERALLYKTGILLYGDPGTGKTSVANAIASYLNCNMITIDMTTFDSLPIENVSQSINADNTRYVILLDEIDSIFTNRDKENLSSQENKAITKLLNFLDSQSSPNNCVFVATTNYIDKIDKAALRNGRFDLLLEINNLSEEGARRMCKGFDLSDEGTNKIIETMDSPYNPATLQTKILEAKRNEMKSKDSTEL